MHIVKIELENITITTHTYISTSKTLGISNDIISNPEKLQHCIQSLITQHENLCGQKINTIHLVCNIFALHFIQIPLDEILHPQENTIITNCFSFKKCKIYELYNANSIRMIVRSFATIGISIDNIWSFFGIFIKNFHAAINSEKLNLFFLGQKHSTFFFFDGTGNVQTKPIPYGILDTIQHISTTAIHNISYLTHENILFILQNFICFRELDMIQKIQELQNNHRLVSVITYEVIQFISNLLKNHLQQIWKPINTGNIMLYTNVEYAKSIKNTLSLITTEKILNYPKNLTITIDETQKHSIIKDFISLFL